LSATGLWPELVECISHPSHPCKYYSVICSYLNVSLYCRFNSTRCTADTYQQRTTTTFQLWRWVTRWQWCHHQPDLSHVCAM